MYQEAPYTPAVKSRAAWDEPPSSFGESKALERSHVRAVTMPPMQFIKVQNVTPVDGPGENLNRQSSKKKPPSISDADEESPFDRKASLDMRTNQNIIIFDKEMSGLLQRRKSNSKNSTGSDLRGKGTEENSSKSPHFQQYKTAPQLHIDPPATPSTAATPSAAPKESEACLTMEDKTNNPDWVKDLAMNPPPPVKARNAEAAEPSPAAADGTNNTRKAGPKARSRDCCIL